MSTYGFKVKDGTNENILTSETATIVSCGTVTMPNALNGDDTYGYDIDLPGTSAISTSKISVVMAPHGNMHWTSATRWGWQGTVSPDLTWFTPNSMLDDYYSYYTKNDSTGVMTAFTPGNRTPNVANTWDAICTVFPLVGWDRTSATITSVRLWAATAYVILDGLSDFKAVYSIGNTGGIESLDYAIFLKEWNY